MKEMSVSLAHSARRYSHPDMLNIVTWLVTTVQPHLLTLKSRPRAWRGFIARVRAALDKQINPVGTGNSKTRSASTYRPVGAAGKGTCQPDCTFLNNGCFAQRGPANLQQERSSADTVKSLAAAVAAILWSVLRDRAARLHVSGDFRRLDGSLDEDYLAGLELLGQMAGGSADRVVAWSYTAVVGPEIDAWVDRLAAVGILVRRSGQAEAGGSVTVGFSAEARAEVQTYTDARPMPCPAQKTSERYAPGDKRRVGCDGCIAKTGGFDAAGRRRPGGCADPQVVVIFRGDSRFADARAQEEAAGTHLMRRRMGNNDI